MQITSTNEKIVVPEKLQNIKFTFDVPDTTATETPKPVVLDIEKTTNVVVQCLTQANIVIPSESKNMDLEGEGTLNIEPVENNDKIEVGKVIPKEDSTLVISSNATEVILDTIQVFGSSTLVGNPKEGSTTKCDNVLLEGGSIFNVDNITLSRDVKIGLNSILNIATSRVNVEDSVFEFFYNRTTANPVFLLKIRDVFPNFTRTSIKITNYAANILLPLDEAIPIASFEHENSNATELMNECNKLKSRYGGNSECSPGNDPEKRFDLYGTSRPTDKGKDKNKLSGGAIAGIVIACIVVAAAIIALLVYFLVIKKKNQSTTSTQGDSSIAI